MERPQHQHEAPRTRPKPDAWSPDPPILDVHVKELDEHLGFHINASGTKSSESPKPTPPKAISPTPGTERAAGGRSGLSPVQVQKAQHRPGESFDHLALVVDDPDEERESSQGVMSSSIAGKEGEEKVDRHQGFRRNLRRAIRVGCRLGCQPSTCHHRSPGGVK